MNDAAHLAAIHAWAQHILACMVAARRPSGTASQWEAEIQFVLAFIEKCVDRKMDLEEFSTYLGISRFHFSRRYKAVTGMPPVKYSMHPKIKKACFLLQPTSLKVKVVSRDLGFDNQYFSRCFKIWVGCSPQNYCKVR